MEIYHGTRCIARRVALCADRRSRGMGLTGRPALDEDEGLLLALPGYQQGKTGLWVAIHMLGVRFPLAVAWLDQEGRVVHRVLAEPGRPYYSSPVPAWYTLELHPQKLPDLALGAQLRWGEGQA